jgi:hypothetical protein
MGILLGAAVVVFAVACLASIILHHVREMDSRDRLDDPRERKRAVLEVRRRDLVSFHRRSLLSEERAVIAADLRVVDAALVRIASDDTAELEDDLDAGSTQNKSR